LQIELTVDKSKLESEVPDHVEGVNIQTVERESKYEHLACYNNTFGGGIHGGVACSSNISTIDEVGTTFCKVMDGNDPGILTASHVVSNGDVYGNMDTSLNYQKIGTVAVTHLGVDITLIKSNSYSIDKVIWTDNNNYNETLGGWVTESGISARVTNPFDGYSKMGSTTGVTTGGIGKYHIDNSYHNDTPDYDGHGVRGSANAAKGDSGGPAYSMHDGDAYVTHIVTQGDPKSGQTNNQTCLGNYPYKKSIGTAAYWINYFYHNILGSSHS
jgi:hypothetical protein